LGVGGNHSNLFKRDFHIVSDIVKAKNCFGHRNPRRIKKNNNGLLEIERRLCYVGFEERVLPKEK